MVTLMKILFPMAQAAVKKGTAAMLCMVLAGLFIMISCKTEVTSVTLNKTELTLEVGETETLIATVLPKDADNKAVTWKSSDNEIATIDNNGLVTAKEAGSTLITTITKDGEKTATCTVTVLCNCIMDTLKGEWSWFWSRGGFVGNFADNRFKSVVKIIDQNKDGTINYEVWVKDTLFIDPLYPSNTWYDKIFVEDTLLYKGSFEIEYYPWGKCINNIKLPYRGGLDSRYHIHFEYWTSIPRKEILIFKMLADDGYHYYYQKIK